MKVLLFFFLFTCLEALADPFHAVKIKGFKYEGVEALEGFENIIRLAGQKELSRLGFRGIKVLEKLAEKRPVSVELKSESEISFKDAVELYASSVSMEVFWRNGELLLAGKNVSKFVLQLNKSTRKGLEFSEEQKITEKEISEALAKLGIAIDGPEGIRVTSSYAIINLTVINRLMLDSYVTIWSLENVN